MSKLMFTLLGCMLAVVTQAVTITDDAYLANGTADEVADRPTFDISKDLLLAQFDGKPDADDIHAQAALGCMLAHSDLAGVNYYAVAGAVGAQGGTVINSEKLFTLAFGSENTYWTDANDDWSGSVARIKSKARVVLDAGGKVWVQEAGQSNITADWIAALISDGVAEAVIKENVIVVQHSGWNEDMTDLADLTYVKDKANYVAIDDGNADPGDYSAQPRRGSETPNYTSTATSFLINAKSDSNTNALTKALWTEADRIIDASGFNAAYSVIPEGGVDFSDCTENWWIFNIGSDADSVRKFWDRYVAKEEDFVISPGTTVYQEANGLVVMDVESAPIVRGWEEETTIAGYLGTNYYTATADSFKTPGNGVLEYTFQIAHAGDYQFQWRSRITEGDSDADHNDSFVRLVDASGNPVVPIENDLVPTGTEQWYKVYMNTQNAWMWHAKNNDNKPKAIAWNLEVDKIYTVQVSYRSKGHGIDRLLLWNRTGFGYSFGDLTGAANDKAALDALPLSTKVSQEPTRVDVSTDFDTSSVAAATDNTVDEDAQVININFSKWSTPGLNTVVGSEQGPRTYSGTRWNNLIGVGAASNLIDSEGYATTVDVDVALHSTWNITTAGHPGFTVLNEYIYVRGASPFTFSGLNAGESYDITFIGHGDVAADTTKFSIGGISKVIAPSDVLATSWMEGRNYITFSGLTADANGEISGTYEPASGTYGFIAGIQIVSATGN